MANPPRQKGTGGETELLRLLNGYGGGKVFALRRNAPNSIADLHQDLHEGEGGCGAPYLSLLATRPDRGEWLITMPLDQFAELVYDGWNRSGGGRPHIDIEVKRYRRFALHSIFSNKFRRGL